MCLDSPTLMLGHSRHGCILAALLHTVIRITDLWLRHVTTLRDATRYSTMIRGKGGDVLGRFRTITSVDAILIAGWFWGIETGL